jgi:hypothetical protein
MSNFFHLSENEHEIVINADKINYVQKLGGSVFVHFTENENPLHLRAEMGQAVWKLVRASSTTIYQAATDNKNAETHSDKGSGN